MAYDYSNEIMCAKELLARAVLKRETGLLDKALEVDQLVLRLTREVGRLAVEEVLGDLARQATSEAKGSGMTVERRPRVKLFTVFGPVDVESPYLRDRATKATARPVKTRLGIEHARRTPAVERALTDFGAEESFGQAAKRFEEHYGWSIGRTTILRVVEARAEEAERYVADRLARGKRAFDEPLAERPGAEKILAELDGCEIRTGKLVAAEEGGKTAVRRLPASKRPSEWREVRVGLARRLDEVEPTYVARMSEYPEVVGQLFAAAVDHGLSSRSQTIAVADGGNGLREEIEVQFPNTRFILDRPHVVEHLYEGADAMELKEPERHGWVERQLDRIDGGKAQQVVAELREHHGRGTKRVHQLAEYLHRFSGCTDYDAFRAQGLPIGSGEVESAHRHIPQKRLKLPGACWDPSTINPMLALRALRANGWWQEFWKSRRAA